MSSLVVRKKLFFHAEDVHLLDAQRETAAAMDNIKLFATGWLGGFVFFITFFG